MAFLVEGERGYELAQKLEASAAWQVWLGDSDYALLTPHLASCGAWHEFMLSSAQESLRLQLRVRALLFDKASAVLFFKTPDLLLHADSVYFTLEQDAEDWNRLQADGSPALTALQIQYGLDPVTDTLRCADDPDSSASSSANCRGMHSCSDHEANVKKEMTREPVNGQVSRLDGSEDRDEIWYNQWPKAHLMERMGQLAYRLFQQKIPIEDRVAFVRTPKGMAKYVDFVARVRRKRKVDAQEPGIRCIKNVAHDCCGSMVNPEMSFVSEEAAWEFPEFMFPGNCVPDNPIPTNSIFNRQGTDFPPMMNGNQVNCGSILEGNTRPGSSGNTKCVAPKKELCAQEAQALLQQTVVKIVAGSGYEGLKEESLDILSDLLHSHLKRLGNNMRMLVDRYGKHCSQAELLRMYMQTAGGGTIAELLDYMKAASPVHAVQEELPQQHYQLQQQMPLQSKMNPTQQLSQLQMQQGPPQQFHHQLSNPMLSQLNQQNFMQVQLDRTKRRQLLMANSRGKNIEGKVIGDTTSEVADSKPYGTLQSVPAGAQQHQLWQPQQQSLQGMLVSQQAQMFQHYKQHLSLQQHASYQPQSASMVATMRPSAAAAHQDLKL